MLTINSLIEDHKPSSTTQLIRSVLRGKRYKLICAAFTVLFALLYMVSVGVVIFTPAGGATIDGTPALGVYSSGFQFYPGGKIIVIPALWIQTQLFVLSIDLAATIFVVASSVLVGINAALIAYLYERKKFLCKREISFGLLGTLPAVFATFACCGAGPIMLTLGAVTFATLSAYSNVFVALTLLLLGLGIRFSGNRIIENEKDLA